MALRAYLMVKVIQDMKPAELLREMQELENFPGVDFVDPVIGSSDVVIMIEAPVTVESIANKIKQRPWITHVEILRVVSLVESCRSSKTILLKSLNRSVLQQASVN
jgi:hypothetical protein